MLCVYTKVFHVQILKIEGFLSAELWSRNPEDEGQDKDDEHGYFTVQYRLKDRAAMDNYLQNHAPHFRQDAIKRFGGRFSATRRILALKDSFSKS